MGVRVGFLAFLLIGGATGAASWIFYPGSPKPSKGSKASSLKGLFVTVLLGSLAAAMSSYGGQYSNLFQSGQMLEWVASILAACVISSAYVALVKANS